ncbi:hypothetical protein E0Z10_g3831 [Xylaria hypoxylon]|uniref:Uncharacterized protein n=1 Tax=Xylaria hypoxylon TaxID=37992 RepID=A0A4Z0Z8N6_9PEZI|nr:hypothetical protein E0Z10_g3831 [Xylaria hypoxylon]
MASAPPVDENSWNIAIEYVDWNGEETGYATGSLPIKEHDGYRKVIELPFFPISFYGKTREAEYKASIIERGKKFEICVDAHAYYETCKKPKRTLLPLRKPEEKEAEEKGAEEKEAGEDQPKEDQPEDTDYDATIEEPLQIVEDPETLQDEEYLLASPWVKDFDLEEKHWCDVRVLLYGPPGTGKQFTAKTVAEKLRVPLYTMYPSSDVVKDLGRAFILCQKWKAVLLLDRKNIIKREGVINLDIEGGSLEELSKLPLNSHEIKNIFDTAMFIWSQINVRNSEAEGSQKMSVEWLRQHAENTVEGCRTFTVDGETVDGEAVDGEGT